MWKGTRSREQGFLLLELALALMVLGMILGPSLTAFRTYQRMRQERVTREHQRIIVQALAHHLSQYGFIPYPAEIMDPAHLKGKGRESWRGPKMAVGIVPYGSLGLPAHVAKDGYHYWMTYVVDSMWTIRGYQTHGVLCKCLFESPSRLDLQEGDVRSVTSSMTMAPSKGYGGVAVILVSHGPQGRGSLLENGTRIPLLSHSGRCKRQNCQDSLFFCAAPPPGDVGINDDLVLWISRAQLSKEAGIGCADAFFPIPAPAPALPSYTPFAPQTH